MIKTDFSNTSESREFRRKNRAKSSQRAKFATTFSKNAVLIENVKHLSISYYKYNYTYKFYKFIIKSTFGNISVIIEFRFENSFRKKIKGKFYLDKIKNYLKEENYV